MPVYQYRARDKEGKVKEGEIEAASEKAAIRVLGEHELVVVSLAMEKQKTELDKYLRIFQRIKNRDIVVMSRQLATMIVAGLPIVESLHVLASQTENERLHEIIDEVARDVEGGTKFSVALAQYPKVFSNFYVNMIKSGESSGQLGKSLLYLSDELEKNYDLNNQVKSALIYPIFILGGIVAVGILMMILVVPQLVGVLESFGGELPLTTRIFIAVSTFFSSWWWLVLVVLIATVVLFVYYISTPQGKYSWDVFKLKIPLIGSLYEKIYVARLTSNLAALISGEIPIIESIKIVAELVGNQAYRDVLLKTASKVKGGDSISSELGRSPIIPDMVSHMIAVGEKTGELDSILERVGKFYSKEVTTQVKGLISLIEPALLVVMGIVIGVILAAVLLPIYNLASTM